MAKMIEVIMQRTDDGKADMVVLTVHSPAGEDMTAQQVLEAVAESLLMNWDSAPMEAFNLGDYDA